MNPEQLEAVPPKKRRRQRDRNTNLPKTADDVKALLAVTQGKSMVEMVSAEAEERMRRQSAELELEKLRKKVSRNPNYLRDGLERAIAMAGETPAETLVRLLHQKNGNSSYVLDARERVAIAKALLPYTVPAFKATETKKEGDVGVTVVVQNFQKPEPQRTPILDISDTK